jgi:hypothetical protein
MGLGKKYTWGGLPDSIILEKVDLAFFVQLMQGDWDIMGNIYIDRYLDFFMESFSPVNTYLVLPQQCQDWSDILSLNQAVREPKLREIHDQVNV